MCQLSCGRATEVRMCLFETGADIFVKAEMLEVWIFVFVLSGNCSGISSMFLMLSDLPETEFHSLIHQPPVSAHTHTHWLQQLPNTKKLLKPRHHQFIYISTIILQGHGGHLFGTVLSEIQYFQGGILPTNDMTQWLFKHRFYCSVRANVGTLLFLCLFFFLHGISM